MFSRKTTRAAAGEYSRSEHARRKLNLYHRPPAAAGPSTHPTPAPSTSSAPSAMRTRSGKLLAPLVEGARAVRSKLTGGRRGAKAPAEVPAPPEASTSAQADATCVLRDHSFYMCSTHDDICRSSNVASANRAPAPRKAAPKKRPATPRARAAKRKTAAANSAPAPLPEADTTPVASALVAIAAPAPAPVAVPPRVATPTPGPSSPPHSDASAQPAVPAHRRLQRQGACYLDKHGWALPEGVSIDKDGNPALSALLEVIEKKISLETFLGEDKIPVQDNLYGYNDERLQGPILSRFYFSPTDRAPIIIGPFYEHELWWQVLGEWNPEVLPTVRRMLRQDADAPEDPTIGTRITRQYADFFGEDGLPLPFEDDGTGEPVPIGEMVANLLKAERTGPLPSTWHGPFFEQEGEASQSVAVAAPASSSVSAVSTPPTSASATPASALSTPAPAAASFSSSAAASSSAAPSTSAPALAAAQVVRPMRPLPPASDFRCAASSARSSEGPLAPLAPLASLALLVPRGPLQQVQT